MTGPAIITSSEPLRVGEWATIVAERNQRDGSLTVNGGVAVKGRKRSIIATRQLIYKQLCLVCVHFLAHFVSLSISHISMYTVVMFSYLDQ